MKTILDYLYYGKLNESERSVQRLHEGEEYKSYMAAHEKLFTTLSEGQKRLFEEYTFNEGRYQCLETERVYRNGVKLGFWLALELMDFKPSDSEK